MELHAVLHFNHHTIERIIRAVGRINLLGRDMIHTAGVQSAAKIVTAPIPQTTGAERGVETPGHRLKRPLAVGEPRRLTEPMIPVELGGNRLGVIGTLRRGTGAAGVDLFDLADRPRHDDRGHVMAVIFHHALGTAGDDAVVLSGRGDDLPALHQREGERLLTVDIFARLAGVDRHSGVPMVRGGDRNDVQIGHLVHLFVVLEGLNTILAIGGEPAGIDIADSDKTRAGAISDFAAARSHTDQTDVDRLTRRKKPVTAQNAAGDEHRRSNRGRGQKASA